ncbi:MAG: sigma 54-dependent Fis family transcriptional regulator [Deltaproteobacteria bacterium]|nr:sigma 54-dependent Fis family transcriptional regulator [Deltaproteobacteria bacterium]
MKRERQPPPEDPGERIGAEGLTERATDRPRALEVRRFRLVVTQGPDAGVARHSEGAAMVVGTHPSADVVLSDRTVSRFHCELRLENGQPVLTDLGSRNGTRLSGLRVFRAPPEDGAVIQVGRTELRFELAQDKVQVPASDRTSFGRLRGQSLAMRALFLRLERAAATDSTVLVEGETGTGKELTAEAIHLESARRHGPFVVLDCGALPPQLLASELMGHERGAFTGADAARQGALVAADGGTLFLDEIGELDRELQPHLLRALERREVKPVGATRYFPVDVRIVAATNRDLRAEVNAGRFRSDLYYRLAVIQVHLPPLRERTDDLPLLVEDILAQLGVTDLDAYPYLRSSAFLNRLSRAPWPGNVRELRNYVEQCLVLEGHAAPIAERPLPGDAARLDQPLSSAREAWVAEFERRYLEGQLRAHGGNASAAARAAGVDRSHFYRLLWRHGLK